MDTAPYFQTQATETSPTALPVTGAMPPWLSGTLLRNGPSIFENGAVSVRHWFDGSAMLHRFAIDAGAVRYASRRLATRHDAGMSRGRLSLREFATDPCQGLFGRAMACFRPNASDNANISIARFGAHTVALAESAMPIVFDPATLATLGVYAIDGHARMPPGLTTAHPITSGGRILGHGTRFGARSRYEIHELDPATRRRRAIASIPTAAPAYMHSFAATARHAVLTEFPFTVRALDLLLSGRPFIENYRWRPDAGTRFLVVDLATGAMRPCMAGPMFGFHHVNAWDDGDDIILDLVCYDDPAIIASLYLDRLRAKGEAVFPQPALKRFRLSPATGRAACERTFTAIELPRIDDRRHGRPHRLVTGIGTPGHGFPDRIGTIDTASGRSLWWSEPGCFAGEPVFVPRPGGEDEDDGVLLSVVLDTAAARSFLLVLDARSLEERARAEAPAAIPAGLHGAFYT